MKELYINCRTGVTAGMLVSALVDVSGDYENVIRELNAIGVPGIEFYIEKKESFGVRGIHVKTNFSTPEREKQTSSVAKFAKSFNPEKLLGVFKKKKLSDTMSLDKAEESEPDVSEDALQYTAEDVRDKEIINEADRGMMDVVSIAENLNLPDSARTHMLLIYKIITEAESRAYGIPIQKVRFREGGSLETIAEIAAVCYLMNKINPDEVTSSPVNIGSEYGSDHEENTYSSSPEISELLKDIKTYRGKHIEGELCTEVGVAILVHFVDRFGKLPKMKPEAVGYGFGEKDLNEADCVRAMFGTSIEDTGNDNVDAELEMMFGSAKSEAPGDTMVADGNSSLMNAVGSDKTIAVGDKGIDIESDTYDTNVALHMRDEHEVQNGTVGREICDSVIELSCVGVKPVTEEIAVAAGRLLAEGAIEVLVDKVCIVNSEERNIIRVITNKNNKDYLIQSLSELLKGTEIIEKEVKRYTMI